MKNEIQRSQGSYLPAGADEPWYQGAPMALDSQQQQQSIKRLHRLLRGRYLLAVVLAVVCGGGGALIGYFSAKPQWRSVGLVQIDPVIPNPGSSIDVVRPMWEQFIRSQEAMIQSQDVIIAAMGSEEWHSTHRGMTPTEINDFVDKLDVAWIPSTSLIRVSFTDPNKSVPQLATRAVIMAYQRKFADQDTNELTQKLNLNDSKRRDLERQIKDKQDLILTYGQTLGTDTPEQYVDQRLSDYGHLQAQYNQAEIQFAIASQQLDAMEAAKKAASTRPAAPVSVEQMATMDPVIAGLLNLRDQQQLALNTLLQTYMPDHPQVKTAELKLTDLNQRLKDRAEIFRKNGGLPLMNDNGELITPRYVDNLKIKMDVLKQKVAEMKNTTQDLGRIRMQIAAARNDVDSLSKQLKDTENIIQNLNTQRSFSNKIRVASYGDTPYVPVFDKRKQYAAMGLLGGAALPIAILLLIGLIDQRYRYSDDTDTGFGGITLLGILPNLPDLLTDPDQAAIAAHCVHQIRTMLQINGAERRGVFAVTSAAPGDGKTSLSLALGLSFAASGSRTLLIDCDLVGGGLTARLNMAAPTGVLEAINTRSLMEFVRPTDIADLSILPLGESHSHHASSLSPAALRRLVDDARKHFDTILIDTGPIQGSIEASSVCAAADGVVLVVARGQQRPQVDKALAHLRAIGASLAGVVFNRAQSRDFDRSVNRLSLARSISRTNGHARTNGNNGQSSGRFGPVAKAVATTYKSPDENDLPRNNDQG